MIINEIELFNVKVTLAKEVAKQSKTALYGLHYKTDFNALFLNRIGLHVLDLHFNGGFDDVLTEDDIECIYSKICDVKRIISNGNYSGGCCN
jgi:hypothetical protein